MKQAGRLERYSIASKCVSFELPQHYLDRCLISANWLLMRSDQKRALKILCNAGRELQEVCQKCTRGLRLQQHKQLPLIPLQAPPPARCTPPCFQPGLWRSWRLAGSQGVTRKGWQNRQGNSPSMTCSAQVGNKRAQPRPDT